MKSCTRCGSYAINHHDHGRDGSDPDLCDVCYWRKRAEYTRVSNATLIEALDWCVAEINRDTPACVNGRGVLKQVKDARHA